MLHFAIKEEALNRNMTILRVRLWLRDRRRDRAGRTVVNQVGWYLGCREWVPYPEVGEYDNDTCPHCGGKSIALRSENWRHRDTDDLYGADLHWCNNDHMWVGEYVSA